VANPSPGTTVMGPLKSGRQLAAARAFAGMDRARLAAASGLSPATIKRLEQGGGVAVRSSTLDRLEVALAAAGIEFTFESGMPGVRSTLPPQPAGAGEG